MKIYYSATSPFVRKCLVAAHELGLRDRIELVEASAHPVARDRALVAVNPLGQVPTLVTDDVKRQIADLKDILARPERQREIISTELNDITAKYGDEQFMLWRRSFDTPPPPIEVGSEFDQTNDPRYAGIKVPLTECLKDVIPRMMPYWENEIRSDLAEGRTVLVTAHGNSLRALVKHLDGISDDDIAGLNIPTGIPLLYELDDNFEPITPGGRYLDPEAAKASIEAVKNQGKK